MRNPDRVDVQLDLKLLKLSGAWEPNDSERRAAWELYVELITRVTSVSLLSGSLREALTSVHSIFASTREILRKYGPDIAEPKPSGTYSFGYLAVTMLNFIIRPRVSYWHPTLRSYEELRPIGTSVIDHEYAWTRNADLRSDLTQMASELRHFGDVLGSACKVPNLSTAIP